MTTDTQIPALRAAELVKAYPVRTPGPSTAWI